MDIPPRSAYVLPGRTFFIDKRKFFIIEWILWVQVDHEVNQNEQGEGIFMVFTGKEKRKYVRVYFNPGDEVFGQFNPYNSDSGVVNAQITNLSMGGLYFTLRRNSPLVFQEKDLVLLNEITTAINLKVTTNILLEVVRVENHDVVDYVGYGCQFVEIIDKAKEQLCKLVEWGLNRGYAS